jgi:hypothetical protein
MTATVNDGLWTFSGDSLRFKGGFNEHGDVFSGVWEQLTDGKTWSHLMNIKLSKIKCNEKDNRIHNLRTFNIIIVQ